MTEPLDDEIAILGRQQIRLFMGPRPGKKSIDRLTALNLTHCCTLLSEREGAQSIEKICQKLGCSWIWLPMDGARLEVLHQMNIAEHIRTFAREIESEKEVRVYFHCSAGIHRTGFFVYLLLRLLGSGRDEAIAELTRLRPVTANQVGEERLSLADDLVASLAQAP